GVDCFRDMIEFLVGAVHDPRFAYHHFDMRHPLYNPTGAVPLGPDARLPLPENHFDVVSMFSVMTHQSPEDAHHILSLLRRYVRPNGQLFFTCFLDADIPSFEDRSPERNGGRCCYNPAFLEEI